MKNNRLTIIVDADAIIAQTNPEDGLHLRAIAIAQKLAHNNARLLYPTTAIPEAVAHMQRVLNKNLNGYKTAKILTGKDMEVIDVTKDTLTSALQYFNPNSSKKNTFFDCIIAALAIEHNADAIFSFDSFYKKLGFKTAEDMLKLQSK